MQELSKNVLRLNFEDLVLNYEHSVEKITNFLGGNIVYKNQCVYFNPKGERSKKSVELRKKYPDQLIMDEILEIDEKKIEEANFESERIENERA